MRKGDRCGTHSIYDDKHSWDWEWTGNKPAAVSGDRNCNQFRVCVYPDIDISGGVWIR